MDRKTIAIDLAKDVFELAIDGGGAIERQRLTRKKFQQFAALLPPSRIVMEACGSANHWARWFITRGHEVLMLPAQHVKPYRRGNKTDRADANALLQADRVGGIRPVPVKSVEQQNLQHLHRLREQWKRTRVARINALRGILREHGHAFPAATDTFLANALETVDADPALAMLRPALHALQAEITFLEDQMAEIERQLRALTRHNSEVRAMQTVSGVGLLTSTATLAAVGTPHHFRNGRQFSAWLGITPREHSSGNRRSLGRITRRGNVYLRTLFIHGARSALLSAKRTAKLNPEKLTRLQRWALDLEQRVGHNKAAVALANKMARITWAVWHHAREFDGNWQPATCAA